jgi:hypothetical protein
MCFFNPAGFGFGFGVKLLPMTLNELPDSRIFLSWVRVVQV